MKPRTLGTALAVAIMGAYLWPSRRERVVNAALRELGNGDPGRYWDAVLPGQAAPADWCGAFALWALQQAGLATGWRWEVGKGFLYRLPLTTRPDKGDVAYFDKSQHHAIVADLLMNGDVELLNGNGAIGVVTRTVVPRSAVTAFYSIEPLL